MPVEVWLPALNAALIVISGICLVIGYVCIRSKRVIWHRRLMLTASVFAALFLITLAGVGLFAMMVGLSKLALGAWHESEVGTEA